MPGTLVRAAIRSLDAVARLLGSAPAEAPHMATGRRGEEDAYFHLRKLGYCMVARNWRSPRRPGEIDLIGWDADVLCFIEVKTRTTRDVKPAEAAVDAAKQREMTGVAREYLRRLPPQTPARCDVVSIYYEPEGVTGEITLFKNAFSMR